jgi:hypothetical protein
MSAPRSGHSATLLADGEVLIVGGMERNGRFLASAELFDPTRARFSPAGGMAVARVGHAAVRLPSGDVLVAGGWTPDGPTDAAELYDPRTRRFALLPARMTARRARPGAALLADGTVLITGGIDAGGPGSRLRSAEVFDPRTRAFRAVSPMADARVCHTTTLLSDGRVLVAGGRDERKGVLDSAEIFDPRSNRFAATGSLRDGRYKHTAALLRDGRVLVAGGSDGRDWNGKLASAEVFDPDSRLWSAAGEMAARRFKLPSEAVRLLSGDILVAGGAPRAEIFDERTGLFSTVSGSLDTARHFMSATPLPGGDVLLAGGYPDSDESTARTWIVRGGR